MELNFRIIYDKVSEMEADEKNDHYPPRFIITIMRNDDGIPCHMQRVECKISCHGEDELFDNLYFNIIIPSKGLPKASSSTVKSKYVLVATSQ